MKRFFKHFPKASIVVAGWDRSEKFRPIQKFWYDWKLMELKEHNLKHKRAVYFTPCDMSAPEHKKENHAGIRAWYCDIDVSTRDEDISEVSREYRKSKALGKVWMCDDLYGIPEPSFIVDTRNGFHVYWLAWNDAEDPYSPSENTFEEIESVIVEKLKGDIKACKTVQLMRLPGFYNWKDEKGYPCRVLTQLSTDAIYVDDDWKHLLKEEETLEERKALCDSYRQKASTNKKDYECIFEKAQEMSQLAALAKFSGTQYVDGEIYGFDKQADGKYNIIINGKGCASFVDTVKNCIFCPSGTKGSPNIIEWLKWYRSYDNWELAEILKKILV